MAISIKNVEKFFDDHPELESRREEVMARAREVVVQDDIVMGGAIDEVFGDLASRFSSEVYSLEHTKIGVEALQHWKI